MDHRNRKIKKTTYQRKLISSTKNLRYAILIWFPKNTIKQINIINGITSWWFIQNSSIKIISYFLDLESSKRFIKWQHITSTWVTTECRVVEEKYWE